MKHYRATPQDGRASIVKRGLPALYEAAREAFGLTATYASVRSNMIKEGRYFRGTDGLRVMIAPDAEADAAYEHEQNNAVVNDDRAVDYMADVYVTALAQSGDSVEHKFERVRATGLMNLIAEAVKLTTPLVGGVMPALEYEAVKLRLPNLRSQMAKSRKNGKASYSIAFPKIEDGYWRGPFPKNHDWRIYIDVAANFEPMPERQTFKRREF